jgi:predicted AlkP superfamily phosphohydrolase/phosphomutase
MSDTLPVILIAFDATAIELIDQLVDAGRMPSMATLRQRGRYGRLQTRPPHFLSNVWPTFFCSSRLGDHAWYFNKLWNPDKQRLQYVHPSWLPLRPFWMWLDESYRIAVLDMPFVADQPTRRNLTLLNGWQCHDDFGRMQVPPGLWSSIESRHGRPCMTPEVFGPQNASTLLAQRREVLQADSQFGDICCDFLRRERFDLFLAVFGSVHRGTHYLWDLSQIDTAAVDQQTLTVLRGARDECYESFDRQLGRIIEAAPHDARIVAFALHGMGSNDGWYERLPQILEQIHSGGGASPQLTFRIKQALPWTLVRQVTRRIPDAWNKALVPLWSRRMYDWSKTRYFALPMDYNGYVRLNVKGREKEGCIDPADVDDVIAELDEALRGFRDVETGRSVIRGTVKVDDVVGADAPRRRFLPDLIVLWDPPHPSSASSGLVSGKYGNVSWPRGQRLRSGRSGNHTPNGWFVAVGPGIAPGESDRTYDTADLIPTVFEWLGAPRPAHFTGTPIDELARRPARV